MELLDPPEARAARVNWRTTAIRLHFIRANRSDALSEP
jgi:hypothetical protein